MCGIAGVHRIGDKPIRNLDRLATELLLELEGRGRDATGFIAVLDSGKVQLEKSVGPARRFVEKRGRINRNARSVLLHTRFKTTGSRGAIDAHPHASGSIASVHNGTIYNADAIFKAFDLPRRASVDSEVVPALINYAGWNQIEAVLGTFTGGAALGIVNVDQPEEMILACIRHYPLCYAVTDSLVIFASTERAIREAWRRTYHSELRAKVVHMVQGDMARVNGTVELSRIPGIKRPAKTKAKKQPTWVRTSAPVSKAAKKRARKDAAKVVARSRERAKDRLRTTYTLDEIDELLKETRYSGEPDPDDLDLLPLWDQDYIGGKSPATLAWEALDA